MEDFIFPSGESDFVIPASSLRPGDGHLSELIEGVHTPIIAQHMEVSEPLSTLRTLLENRFSVNLRHFKFYLQDTQELSLNTTLVEQCIQGEGLVQVNIELSFKNGSRKINIVDVLKLSDETLAELGADHHASKTDDDDQVCKTKWVQSPEFKYISEKEGIPPKPTNWKPKHTQRWFQWASKHFKLPDISINPSKWFLSGEQLAKMTHEQFREKVPYDADDLMWIHLELLRKCNMVAIMPNTPTESNTSRRKLGEFRSKSVARKSSNVPLMPASKQSLETTSNRAGNNGQVQLWQFLLEMLTDKDARDYITWLENDAEFKLINPEMVAQMWGLRKNKPSMNYEKLSRALRYYYDGDMITKVQGKRFVYKFVVDLKQLIGYDARELHQLVLQAEQRKISRDHSMNVASHLTL